MSEEMIKLWASMGAIMIGTIAPAIAIGWIGSHGVDAIGRNPEAAPRVQTAMILAIAFAEAIAIYVLVIALSIKFV
ncbi:MAG: ATP synthase F0 subunit C [Candidatus Liptonbacteria bacterium]